jgi:uncharacterized protein
MELRGVDVPGTLARRRLDMERGVLLGSRCDNCGATSWPARAICHSCGHSTTLGVPLPNTGTLLSYTRVWVPRPGIQPPYLLGEIALDGGALLFAHVRLLSDGAKVPMPVRLVIPAAESSEPIAFWWESE